MEETTQTRRKLIIKIHLPRSATTNRAYSAVDERAIGTDSRTVSKVCPLKNKKGYYATAIWVNVDNPSDSSVTAEHSKTSRTENPSKPHGADPRNPSKCSGVADSGTLRKRYESCKLKKKRESVGVEGNTRVKKQKMQNMIMMNCSRKVQCWAALKRLMVGRDAWALKQPLVHHNSQAFRKKKLMGLEDIESKSRKLGYSEVDDFAHDIRLVFSYVLGYPPKSEVYRTAKKISENFEVNCKRLKDEWMHEERDKEQEDVTKSTSILNRIVQLIRSLFFYSVMWSFLQTF